MSMSGDVSMVSKVAVNRFIGHDYGFHQFTNSKDIQCSKLRVHPAPCVHDFNAGCTILKEVHPACARFSHNLVYILVYVHMI